MRTPSLQSMVADLREVLLRIALLRCRNNADAEDLVQDASERTLRTYRGPVGIHEVRAYLIRVMTNCFIDRCRRRRSENNAINAYQRVQNVLQSPIDEGLQNEDAQTVLWRNVSSEMISQAMQHLEPEFRGVFELREIAGQSYREIATTLGIPANTVGTRLGRARRKLKEILISLRRSKEDCHDLVS